MNINTLDSSLPRFIGLSTSDSPQRKGYWLKTATRLAAQGVQVVDTLRYSLRELREALPRGTKVYRASTGGKWGRSAEVVKL